MTDDQEGSDAGRAAENLRPIDVLLPARKGWRRARHFLAQWQALVMVGLALVLVWAIGANRLSAPIPEPAAQVFICLVFLTMIVGGFWAHAGKAKHPRSVRDGHSAFATALGTERPPTLHELVAAGSRPDGILTETRHEAELVRSLQGRRLTGVAIRMSCRSQRLAQPLEPLRVPFEPTPLNRAYARLFRPRLTGENRLIEVDFSAWAKAARQVVLALRRSGILGGYGGWALSRGLIGIMVGRVTGLDLLNAVVLPAWLAIFVFVEHVAGHLYLIPGGLIDVRRRKVYRREKGLMVWCPDTFVLHVLTTEAGSDLSFTITPAEAELALRGWLSPVPGPSDELIASFLAGRG